MPEPFFAASPCASLNVYRPRYYATGGGQAWEKWETPPSHTHTVVCTVFALKEKSGLILCLPLFAALLQLGIEFQVVRDGGVCARVYCFPLELDVRKCNPLKVHFVRVPPVGGKANPEGPEKWTRICFSNAF